MEEVQQDSNQQTEGSQQADPNTQETDNLDLISRASEISPEIAQNEEGKFDRNAHDELLSQLPEDIQAQVKGYEKEVFAGANKKFQEAAEMRKQIEDMQNAPMDRNQVQALLNDPNFQREVTTLQQEKQMEENPQGSGVSDEEWSYLSPKEKQLLGETRKEQIRQSKRMDSFFQSQENQRLDDQLKTRYKNYDPQTVDQVYKDLTTNKLQATREHLWKVVDYDAAVKRAYRLGQQDQTGDLRDKMDASSVGSSNINVTASNDVPKKSTNESGVDYFKRLAFRNAQRLGKK